ncbi:MAG: hypothetical protein M3040_10330 [Bacteroidota bacterium]|nr:hypothetical protein [Bacteroidota bacterium]
MQKLVNISIITAMLFLILGLCVVACDNAPGSVDASKETTHKSTAAGNAFKTDYSNDSIIAIDFPKDSDSVTITGRIKGIDKPVTINISVLKAAHLSAVLIPADSIANVRINQIYMPDGKADGPFGRTFNRKITQKGNCRIIIGEDLMQGEEWKGKFTLTLRLE